VESKGNPSLAQWRQQSLEWGKKSFATGQRMSSIGPLDFIAPFPSEHLADGYQVLSVGSLKFNEDDASILHSDHLCTALSRKFGFGCE
jgi:hypothetical protein